MRAAFHKYIGLCIPYFWKIDKIDWGKLMTQKACSKIRNVLPELTLVRCLAISIDQNRNMDIIISIRIFMLSSLKDALIYFFTSDQVHKIYIASRMMTSKQVQA